MNQRALWIVLLVALAGRLALLAAAWSHPERLLAPDSRSYVELSDSLAEDGTFRRDGRAEIFRTPGYPAFLLVGVPFGRYWVPAAALVQIAADVLLVYLTYLLGCVLCDRGAGLWAAAFQALSIVAAVASVRVLSDSLYAMGLTLSVLLVCLHFRTLRWWPLLTGAVVAGGACYFRPVGIAAASIVTIALLLGRPGLRRAAAFAGIVACVLAPWVVRNYAAARYVGFSSFATDSAYFFAVPELISQTQGIRAADARRQARVQARQYELEHPDLPPGPAAHHRARAVRQAILQQPGTYATIHLKQSGGFWLPGASDVAAIAGLARPERGTIDVLHAEGLAAAVNHYFGGNPPAVLLAAPLVAICILGYLAAAGGALIGAVKTRLRLGAAAWMLVALVVVSALLPGPSGLPRYRVAITPLLSLAAGLGVVNIWRWRTGRRTDNAE